jgi:hypothetical protein
MTTAKLPYRLPDLAGIPEPMKQFYAPCKDGGFELQLDGAPRSEPLEVLDLLKRASANPQSGFRPKKTEADAREELLTRILDRIDPRPEQRDAVARVIRPLVHVDLAEDGTYTPRLNHPSGFRWPSSLPNNNFCDEFEFVARVTGPKDHGGILSPDVLRPPEQKPTLEKLALDDSEPFSRAPRNVRLPRGSSQRDFEDAVKLAESRGGQVIFDESLDPPVEPTAKYRPGKDVPLRGADCDGPGGQVVFERAMKLAQSQGGDVIFIDEVDQRTLRNTNDRSPFGGTGGA